MPRTRNDTSIPKTFRLYSKTFFLTYAQCPEPKETLRDLLFTFGTVKKLAIGRETHEDGNYHLHALVQYEKKINVRSETYFDLNDYHPSIESPRNIQASINYCCKEDQNPLLLDCATDQLIDDLYILARDTPETEYFEICRKKKVSIHLNLGQLFVCRSGIPKDARRTKRKHYSGEFREQWNDYINHLGAIGIANGFDVNMDQRTEWDREDNLGTPLCAQTCTIRETSGYTARIQKWIPYEHHLRRYVIQSSSTPSSNRPSRPVSPATSPYPVYSNLPSGWDLQDLFVK